MSRGHPVKLVFRSTERRSALTIKALTDGGLARLIAARIARDLGEKGDQKSDPATVNQTDGVRVPSQPE
jgi:hypothetical protein